MKLSPAQRTALLLTVGAATAVAALAFGRGGIHGAVAPRELSRAHEFLQADCGNCHPAYERVRRGSCATCHAAMPELLRREATAFHAWVPSCIECHVEHVGRDAAPTQMDHEALAQLLARVADLPSAAAADLDCTSCHRVEDTHRGSFGDACDGCHGEDSWAVPGYRHPGPRSRDCNLCHPPPLSHLMGHYEMVSAAVAGKPSVPVEHCWACHETTDWNDIVGVGWYDHH